MSKQKLPPFESMAEYIQALEEREAGEDCSAAPCSPWRWHTVGEFLPTDGEWVLHCYYGVRKPMYGRHQGGQFFKDDGPESFPTTHWLAIPFIEANA